MLPGFGGTSPISDISCSFQAMSQFWLLYLWTRIRDHVLGLFFPAALGDNAHLCAGSDNGDC